MSLPVKRLIFVLGLALCHVPVQVSRLRAFAPPPDLALRRRRYVTAKFFKAKPARRATAGLPRALIFIRAFDDRDLAPMVVTKV